MKVDIDYFFSEVHRVCEGFDMIAPAIGSLKKQYSSCTLIADATVYELYGEEVLSQLNTLGIPVYCIKIAAGEVSKNLQTAGECWSSLIQCGLDRRSLIVSLGGGATTDLAGFVASGYMRGIDVVHIPTTLLAMVDAAIGGKTAINLAEGKNLVGTFHPPKKVLILPHFLATLNDREYRSGLAEIIKSAVIKDELFFVFLEERMAEILNRNPNVLKTILEESSAIKAKIVSEDEQEHDVRAVLNYGHTFGHAIETATKYKRYCHGEAVSIGMSCAAHIGKALGYVDDVFIKRQDAICQAAGLPTALPVDISTQALISLMQRDKKVVFGKINLIVPEKIGKVIRVREVIERVIAKALEEKRLQDK